MISIDKSLWGGEEKFDSLLAAIRDSRQVCDDQRYLSSEIVDQFKEIGIYRAFTPKEFGGSGRTPAEFLLAIEAIAAANGSAGWVASFGMNPAYLAALPIETIQQVWKDSPDVVFAGGIFPPKPAERIDGGFAINGRWQFGSGCMGASLIGVGIMPDNGEKLPRMAVLPREKVEIDQNSWDVHGMVATGSFDLVVKDQIVPEAWTFVRGAKPTLDSPFFRYPSLGFAAQVLSVCALGVARESIDMVLEMAAGRVSVTGAPNLGERAYAQMDIAKAEAKLRSSRAFFYEATLEAWDTIIRGDELSDHQKSTIRLATSNLTHECADVVRAAYKVAGMTSPYYSHHLSRCLRDVHLTTQHAFMGEITFQNAGAMLFGHKPLPGYL